jgi:hypothetical protein
MRALKVLAVWCAASLGFTLAWIFVGLVVHDVHRRQEERDKDIATSLAAARAWRPSTRDWGFDS